MSLLVDGRRALFAGLIDYAGMFPPASEDVEHAVAGYRRGRDGAHGWMLGRFLCPASRLEELAAVLTATMRAGDEPWRIGAVLDGPAGIAATTAAAFHRHMEPAAAIDAVELRTPPEAADGRPVDAALALLAEPVDAALAVAPGATPYLEIARTGGWAVGIPNAVAAVAELRSRRLRPVGAKLRTGGLDADAFPSPEQVARFITSCARSGTPFKLTAGLHHPVRHHDPGLDVMRHGFLNLLVATALAATGADESEVADAVADDDPSSFLVGPGGITWSGRRLMVPALRSMRGSLFPAYGSCSFDEPVDDLVALGMLEPA
jgi:hypothetical protein